jgi:hypothetical protein
LASLCALLFGSFLSLLNIKMDSSFKERPDWEKLYGYRSDHMAKAQELVVVTRHTAELAMSALKERLARDWYNNSARACQELDVAINYPETNKL